MALLYTLHSFMRVHLKLFESITMMCMCGSASTKFLWPFFSKEPWPVSADIITCAATACSSYTKIIFIAFISQAQVVPLLLKVSTKSCLFFTFPYLLFNSKSNLFIVMTHLIASGLGSRLQTVYTKIF